MNFSYETQGAITYLVCELEASEQLDNLTLGMLTNNHIAGLAPILYTEMNGQRYLKYNVSAKLSSKQFFCATMNKQRTLAAFGNILNAVCSADEYMIDQNCFTLQPEYVYINVSNCETAMVCLPVVTDKDINAEIASFFKNVLSTTQFDKTEDTSYVEQLNYYVNNTENLNIYGLMDIISKLQRGEPTGIVVPAAQKPEQPAPAPKPVPPVSSFDSTITIDEMPSMIPQQPQVPSQPAQPPVQQQPQVPSQPVQPPVQPQPQVPAQPMQPPVQPQPQTPVRPMQPPVQPQPQTPVRPMQPPVQQQPQTPVRPMQPPVQQNMPNNVNAAHRPIQNNVPQGNMNIPQPKPPVPNGPGFAIPGQPVGAPINPQTPPAPAKKKNKKEKKETDPNKKMSWLGLMSNYSKENAEIYKKQKEEAKASKEEAKANKKVAKPKKETKPTQPPVQKPVGPVSTNIPGQPPIAQAPASMNAPQQFAQPQYRPAVQPVPVQSSFNETTVLSPSMMSGETTVLSENPALPDPCLTRIKTGERIKINKPVFRIGKEKSYVDYFIADNTAISRSHANIHTENGEYFIEDTNSTNHTYINGTLINSNVKTKITSGDKVRLANEDFTFSV